VRVIGVGNRDRGDDGIGPVVADRVAALAPDGVVVATASPDQLIDVWGRAQVVVMVDAIRGEGPPGTVRVFTDGEIPGATASVSSHGIGIPEAIDLAAALDRLPERLVVVGVTGEEFDGTGLSPPVERAVDEAVDAVMEVVADA
jgi:hydrogenase maturation protease